MKESKYNFFFKVEENGEEKYLGYNAISNGLALMEPETVDFVRNIQNEDLKNLRIDEKIFKELKEGGFIVDDDFDEIQLLRFTRDQMRFSTSTFSLTILPTLDCNLGCKYCFEMRKPIYMDEKVYNQLLSFAESNIYSIGAKILGISWYGGEPLLKFDLIEKFTKDAVEMCKKYNCFYSASMVTNGTLITEDVAEKIKKLGIMNVQITLDGDPETHNVRRPYLDGRGSFEDVLKGIKNLDKAGVPVSIRVNIDRTNSNLDLSFLEKYGLVEILRKKENRIYFGFVKPCTSSCGCSQEECFTHVEFYDLEFRLKAELREKYGIEAPFYPSPVYGCVATSPYGYVVGPKGELYKCWEDVGRENEEVGNIFEGPKMDKNHLDHLTLDVGEGECLNCKFLPICNGGCPKTRIKRLRGLPEPLDCNPYKFNLKRSLEYYYTKVYTGDEES